MKKALEWLFGYGRDGSFNIVRVKSLRPWFGPHGIEWPVLLVEEAGIRSTIAPVWDRLRWSNLLRRVFRCPFV
jgi:hypothetical protein